MSWPVPVEQLVKVLGRLPGVGRRSAERMAVHLARDRNRVRGDLISALRDVEQRVQTCTQCGCLTLRGEDPCFLCRDPSRDDAVLCVVEDATDIELIERTGAYRGRYWTLGARLSPARGEGIESLRLDALVARVGRGVKEVILALEGDLEREATTGLLCEALGTLDVKLTRLARGIPAGSGLAYADPVTLTSALRGRHAI